MTLYMPNTPQLREFDFSDLSRYHLGDLSFEEHAAIHSLPDYWPQIRVHMASLTDAQWKLLDGALDKVFAQDADEPSAELPPRTRFTGVFLTERLTCDHQRPHSDG